MANAEHEGTVKNVKKWICNFFTVFHKITVMADFFLAGPVPFGARLTLKKDRSFYFEKVHSCPTSNA